MFPVYVLHARLLPRAVRPPTSGTGSRLSSAESLPVNALSKRAAPRMGTAPPTAAGVRHLSHLPGLVAATRASRIGWTHLATTVEFGLNRLYPHTTGARLGEGDEHVIHKQET